MKISFQISALFLPCVWGTSPSADREGILQLINNYRVTEGGCQELGIDHCFTESAQSHATEMASFDYLWYDGFLDGQPPEIRVPDYFGCKNFTDEAIALTNGVDSYEVLQQLIADESHKVLNCEYDSVGIGYAGYSTFGYFYWAFDFGNKYTSTSTSTTTSTTSTTSTTTTPPSPPATTTTLPPASATTTYPEDAYPPIPHQEHERPELEIVYWANEHRKADPDCPMLQVNEILTGTARYHSADMAAMGMITHDGSDGSTMWERAWTQGYDGYALQNIASGFGNITETVVAIWMEGESSAEFIMNCKNTDAGVGVYVNGDDGLYHWTFMAGYSYPPLGDLDPDGIMNAFIEQANQERECPVPIALDNCLTASAQSQAEDMVDNGFFSSSSSDGTKSGVRVRELFGCQNFRHEAIFATSTKSQTAFFTQYMEGSARAPKILDCTNVLVGIGNKGSRWAFDYAHARLP